MTRFNTRPMEQPEDGAYETIRELYPQGPKSPVFIRAAKSVDAEKRWQVARLNSVTYLDTFHDVQTFCRERGWA